MAVGSSPTQPVWSNLCSHTATARFLISQNLISYRTQLITTFVVLNTVHDITRWNSGQQNRPANDVAFAGNSLQKIRFPDG